MKIQDVELYTEVIQGEGSRNFVMLHNAGGNHQFFIHQIETLKKLGNVILLDLPGHSKSQGITHYKMSDLSSVINQVCQNLSLTNISLIGLNNGATIALDVALHYALPISSLILIDPPLFLRPAFVAEIKNFITQLAQEDYSQFVNALVNALFIHTEPYNKAIATQAFMSVDKKALQAIFQGLIEWDAQLTDQLKNITCPTLCILTDEHHCQHQTLRQAAPQFEIGIVVGSKCWATLEVPDQINAMISRFVMLN